MGLSPDAAELITRIRDLRAEREQRYQRDLDIIDAAYDRELRRVGNIVNGRPVENPFPLVKAYSTRHRSCRRAKRLRRQQQARPR